MTGFWISGFFLVLIAANALGIGAASFASVSGFGDRKRDLGTGTGFGDGDEVTEPVEVPSPYLERARRKHSEQRYSGKPDGDSRNAQISYQLSAISYQRLKI